MSDIYSDLQGAWGSIAASPEGGGGAPPPPPNGDYQAVVTSFEMLPPEGQREVWKCVIGLQVVTGEHQGHRWTKEHWIKDNEAVARLKRDLVNMGNPSEDVRDLTDPTWLKGLLDSVVDVRITRKFDQAKGREYANTWINGLVKRGFAPHDPGATHRPQQQPRAPQQPRPMQPTGGQPQRQQRPPGLGLGQSNRTPPRPGAGDTRSYRTPPQSFDSNDHEGDYQGGYQGGFAGAEADDDPNTPPF